MSDLSLGIIEIIGLAGAIEAADVCLKSANIKLVGYELTNGDGMAVVKIEGNVGDVKAAVEASIVSANKVSKVISYKIIPRPSMEINFLVRNKDTVGSKNYSEITEVDNKEDNLEINLTNESDTVESTDIVESIDKVENDDTVNNIYMIENEDTVESTDLDENTDTDDFTDIIGDTEKLYTCNLCKDPMCKRQKGELRSACIHYKK